MHESVYRHLVDARNIGKKSSVVTYVHLGSDHKGSILKKFVYTQGEGTNSGPSPELYYRELEESLEQEQLLLLEVRENEYLLSEPVVPSPRLLVFGGGHVAVPVVELGAKIGFRVIVMDDRPYFADPGRFPLAEKVICDSFEHIADTIETFDSDFAVVITRGHRHDGIVLRSMLKRTLKYLGMIGSKRRVKALMEELREEGYSSERLEQVYSPIGLEIGAITPEEIGVSIAAQLIQVKNQSTILKFGRHASSPEFDEAVMQAAAEETEDARALITIVRAKGSVPRKTGAKMILYPDGRTVGSIGGGCSEADVLTTARGLLSEKGSCCLVHVDMTGEVAESEGMVCGGIIDVLIEII